MTLVRDNGRTEAAPLVAWLVIPERFAPVLDELGR